MGPCPHLRSLGEILWNAVGIGAVETRLDLLGSSSSVKYIVQGLILVAAASLDALGSKRKRG